MKPPPVKRPPINRASEAIEANRRAALERETIEEGRRPSPRRRENPHGD